MTQDAVTGQQDGEEEVAGDINWVALLRGALMDEKAAPDILEFKDDILKAVIDLMEKQTRRVKAMQDNSDLEMERIIYERDLQRTKWLIKAYHRTRIRKLEEHVQYYLHHEEYTRRLSVAELEYSKDYFTALGRHAHQIVLKDLPPHFQSFTLSSSASQQEDMIPAPDVKRTVMMRPAFDSVHIPVSSDSTETMAVYQGDIVVVQYSLIQQLLLNEDIRLL